MTTSTPPELLRTLEEAASGLLFPSETDAPLTPFELGAAAQATDLTPEALARALNSPEGTRVEPLSPHDLFAPLIEAGDADAAKYTRTLEIMTAELEHVRAYRVGAVDIDVYILGRHPSGAWIGLKTKVVET